MSNILKSIEGTDGRKLLVEYFPKIMKELIEGLDSSQWRVREASSNAISEAFQVGGLVGSFLISSREGISMKWSRF